MQRIMNLLQKLSDLANKNGEPELIDVDLMLDYTKVIYADLLEMRGRISFNSSLINEQPQTTGATPPLQKPPVETAPKEYSQAPEVEPTPDIPTVNEAEKIADPILSSHPANTNLDIRKIIGINDKYLYISELFNGNANVYEQVLDQLNSFGSYPEAISWLDEVHSENNWNDENDTVVSFYNIINHYFASK